jgi:hypothetical protein
LPVRLALTPSETLDNRLVRKLLSRLQCGSMLIADRSYLPHASQTQIARRANPSQAAGIVNFGKSEVLSRLFRDLQEGRTRRHERGAECGGRKGAD